MTLEQRILQLIATGVTTGSIYALLGLGLVVVYSTTRVVNVAIGEFAMIGALVAATLVGTSLPLALALPLAVATGTLAGLLMYRVAIRPAQARGADVLTLLIITIALHLALKGAGLILWGTDPYSLPAFTPGPPVRLLSASVTRQSLWVAGVTAAILAGLWAFFTHTVRGKALRACAVNPVGARLMGIPVEGMGMLAFSLSAALAAAGGVLITPITMATYDMGLILGLKGFVGAVIGRLADYPLTVAGCLLLGLLESLAAGLLPSGYRDAVAFSLLIMVLVWRALPLLRHGVLVTEEAARE